MPPIIAYHVVFSAYGFWLPNDPRGSGSDIVWARNLRRFGPATRVTTRHSVAAKPHDHSQRLTAKCELKHAAVKFNGVQARAVARGIGVTAAEYHLPVYATAVMPDHVHMVIGRHMQTAEEWVGYFKRAASRKLRSEGVHPFASAMDAQGRLPTPWGVGGWQV